LSDDTHPLDHLPDPDKRFKVFAFTRGTEAYIELIDETRKTGVVMDLASVLRAAADINLEATRIMEVMAEQVEQGTMRSGDSSSRSGDRTAKTRPSGPDPWAGVGQVVVVVVVEFLPPPAPLAPVPVDVGRSTWPPGAGASPSDDAKAPCPASTIRA